MAAILDAASSDARVRMALGERSVYLYTALGRNRTLDGSERLRTRVTYYSYTYRVAVEVTLIGVSVEGVFPHRGFQPPEARSEVEEAVRIAAADARLADRVRDLEAHGILLPLSEENAGEARLIWLTYTEASSTDDEQLTPLHAAIVDLIEQRVVLVRTDLTVEGGMRHAELTV